MNDAGTSTTPSRETWTAVWIWTLAAAALVTALGAALPPEAFFSGDSGLKLIAARNAIDHPRRPFAIDLPRIGGAPVPYVEKFLEPHGDHAHILQSPLFPVISAPFIAWLGARGAYVLPALSFVVLTALLEIVRRCSVPGVPASLLGFVAVLANPIFFYALEYWEHVPAVALLAGSTALLWSAPVGHERAAGVAAGALAAFATLLRPEALWYAAGLALTCSSCARLAAFVLGGAALLVPFVVGNYLHSGAPAGAHATWNLALLKDAWLDSRRRRLEAWLITTDCAVLAGLALVAAAWLALLARRGIARAQVLGAAGALVISVAAARRALSRDLLWQAWPLAVLLLVPQRSSGQTWRLRALAGVTLTGVVLTATHDGGAQWGPRFMFIASPAFVVLAAVAAHDVGILAGEWRAARSGLVAAILACAVLVNGIAYRELRATKQSYAVAVEETRKRVPAGGTVVTDVWWFEQITAALYGRYTVLFADDVREARRIVKALAATGAHPFTFVESLENGWLTLAATVGRTCYVTGPPDSIAIRSLVFTNASCPESSPKKRGPASRRY